MNADNPNERNVIGTMDPLARTAIDILERFYRRSSAFIGGFKAFCSRRFPSQK
jgi:hypothetical protein